MDISLSLLKRQEKGDLATSPHWDHFLPILLRFATGHASPHELPPLPPCRNPACVQVIAVAAAARYQPDSLHYSHEARRVEQNRYPRITNGTASSPSSAYILLDINIGR